MFTFEVVGNGVAKTVDKIGVNQRSPKVPTWNTVARKPKCPKKNQILTPIQSQNINISVAILCLEIL
jgi:hypothetical protein